MGMFSDGCLIAPNVGKPACLRLTSMPIYLGVILFLAFCLDSGFGHSLLLLMARILLLFPGMGGPSTSVIFKGLFGAISSMKASDQSLTVTHLPTDRQD